MKHPYTPLVRCGALNVCTLERDFELSNLIRKVVFAAIFTVSVAGIFLAAARASIVIHSAILCRILGAPMAFFDTQPIGRILSRFSMDIEVIDVYIPNIMTGWFQLLIHVLQSFLSRRIDQGFFCLVSHQLYFFVVIVFHERNILGEVR